MFILDIPALPVLHLPSHSCYLSRLSAAYRTYPLRSSITTLAIQLSSSSELPRWITWSLQSLRCPLHGDTTVLRVDGHRWFADVGSVVRWCRKARSMMACRNAFISLTDATRLTVRFVDYAGIRTRRQMVRSLDCIFLLTIKHLELYETIRSDLFSFTFSTAYYRWYVLHPPFFGLVSGDLVTYLLR